MFIYLLLTKIILSNTNLCLDLHIKNNPIKTIEYKNSCLVLDNTNSLLMFVRNKKNIIKKAKLIDNTDNYKNNGLLDFITFNNNIYLLFDFDIFEYIGVSDKDLEIKKNLIGNYVLDETEDGEKQKLVFNFILNSKIPLKKFFYVNNYEVQIQLINGTYINLFNNNLSKVLFIHD